MPFVTTKKLLSVAQKEGFAVGAFNVNNMEFIQGIVGAAKELDSPVILQFSKGARAYAGSTYIMKLVEAAEKETKLPIAIHLDHGPDYAMCKASVDDGFTSVMFDGSHLPYEENVMTTKKVVGYAHKRKVSVEAELGQLIGSQFDIGEGGKLSKDAIYTNPIQAKEFVKKTGCDSLAVAIGTSHGAYKFKARPRLDFKRLAEIRNDVDIPLVLHGASSVLQPYVKICNKNGAKILGSMGVPESQLKEAVKLGVQKINTDTDLRLAFTAGLRRELNKNPGNFDPREYLKPAREMIADVVKQKIKLFGCEGKAGLYR